MAIVWYLQLLLLLMQYCFRLHSIRFVGFGRVYLLHDNSAVERATGENVFDASIECIEAKVSSAHCIVQ